MQTRHQVIKARATTQVKVALAELRRLAQLCRELEVSETERDTLLANWESEIELPRDWRQRIEQRRDQSETPDAKRLAVISTRRRAFVFGSKYSPVLTRHPKPNSGGCNIRWHG